MEIIGNRQMSKKERKQIMEYIFDFYTVEYYTRTKFKKLCNSSEYHNMHLSTEQKRYVVECIDELDKKPTYLRFMMGIIEKGRVY